MIAVPVASGAASTRAVRSGPWAGSYLVGVKTIDQASNWQYNHSAVDTCDYTGTGSGAEQLSMVGGSRVQVAMTGVTAPGELSAPAGSLNVISGGAAGLSASGTVDRSGSITITSSTNPDCSVGDGGGGGGPPTPPDCGVRAVSSTLTLSPEYNFQLGWRPIATGAPGTNDPFVKCPAAPHSFPNFLNGTIPLNPAAIGPGMPPVAVRGTAVDATAAGDTTGTTKTTVVLELSPLAVVPAIALASRSSVVGLGAHDVVATSVQCGGPRACSGSLTVTEGALPAAAAQTAFLGKIGLAAAAKVRFPVVPMFSMPKAFASVKFKLAARGKKKLRLKLRNYSPAKLKLPGRPLLLVAKSGRGKKKVSYAIGTVAAKR